MFFVLPTDDIVELTSNMGVELGKDDFETFDLLKDLECAIYNLFNKQKENSQVTQTESVGNPKDSKSPLPIEWI